MVRWHGVHRSHDGIATGSGSCYSTSSPRQPDSGRRRQSAFMAFIPAANQLLIVFGKHCSPFDLATWSLAKNPSKIHLSCASGILGQASNGILTSSCFMNIGAWNKAQTSFRTSIINWKVFSLLHSKHPQNTPKWFLVAYVLRVQPNSGVGSQAALECPGISWNFRYVMVTKAFSIVNHLFNFFSWV